jgi:ATP-dependent Clp protease ATP-binding subunit ClpA
MFDKFSTRARQVVFVARFKAGERGARMIEVDDLLAALVLEDQGMSEKIFSDSRGDAGTFVSKAPSHLPFFSPETAEHLLTRIKDIPPQSDSVGLTEEIPLSPALEKVFDSANGIQTQFQRSQIEPLLLLAAIVTQPSSECTELLNEFGITQESVLAKLRGTSDN